MCHQSWASSCLSAATVVRDKVTDIPKGFGFVKFASPEEANNAREEMNGKAKIYSLNTYYCLLPFFSPSLCHLEI
jgi:RNA recognition motif-containing protein